MKEKKSHQKKNIRKILVKWSREYKKGFLSFFVLIFLKEKPMYGYEIHHRLEELTGQDGFIQESSIYQILKKMQKLGLVSSYWKKSPRGPKRKYYRLQASGLTLLEEFTRETAFPIIRAAALLGQIHYPYLWEGQEISQEKGK
ncbi:PadR family transcriptional regulator [Candidatus Aminicenantes bacterium AC-334-K16]|jgi:PadR family transcriptional regulator PadR|nr:PadR family transcriptional regulator [Candidatus Aminicenantes bacterium AC-334-K16]